MAVEATKKLCGLRKQDLASEFRKQQLDKDKADAKLLDDSDEGDFLDPDCQDMYYDTAEDADDEIDSDEDYEEIRPLVIKKAKPGKASDPVHPSTSYPEQNTETNTHTHHHVKWADNLAQVQRNPAGTRHTAPTASVYSLSLASTLYPEPLSVGQVSKLLHHSPPLRRRKGSMALGKETSDSTTDHSMMSMTGENQSSPHGPDHEHTMKNSQNSDTYLTPTHLGKMSEAGGNQDASSGEDQGNRADIDQSNETPTSSDNSALKRKTSGFPKADAVLGYGEEGEIVPKKSTINLVTSPKAIREKKPLRKLFHSKGSRESTTPPLSSRKTAGRMTISAPTLVGASPDAKVLLDSASSLTDASPEAKNVVNYSRPIVHHSSSDVSTGSPVVPGRSSSALYSSKQFPGPDTSTGGLTEKSGRIPVGVNTSSIHGRSNASATHRYRGADEHGAIPETLATDTNPNASDSDSFNASDYSGDENSVQQAVAIPIIFSGRAKLVNVRSPNGANSAASGKGSGVGSATARNTMQLTDEEAMALGAQDADRYYANALTSHTCHATTNTDDPFVGPALQNMLAKPANDIAAEEMEKIKAARKARNMGTGSGLVERMNALLAKSDSKPRVENTGYTTADPRTNDSETLLSKMRTLGKKPKKGKEPEDSEEEVFHKIEAEKERGLREEKEIHARIKAKLAAKDAVNGGVRGAGIPRIDYGPPNLSTALGGCGPTDEERANTGALENRHAAGMTGGRVQNNSDNTTARGLFEGY